MRSSRRKRLLLSLLTVLLWLGLVSRVSNALLSDQTALTGNSIISGTASLLLSNSQDPVDAANFEESVPGFTYNMLPGDQAERYFFLKNGSSDNVPLAIQIHANASTSSSAMIDYLTLVIEPVNHEGVVLNGVAESLVVTLRDLTGTSSLGGLVLDRSEVQRFRIRTLLSSEYATANSTLKYDLIFTGTQVLQG